MTVRYLHLCDCCAMKLTNDDESACRDFYNHDHPSLDVPDGTVITGGPFAKDDALSGPDVCDGHGGVLLFGSEYWTAEASRPADEGITA